MSDSDCRGWSERVQDYYTLLCDLMHLYAPVCIFLEIMEYAEIMILDDPKY